MDAKKIEAIWRTKFTVKVYSPETGRFETTAFETDLEAVWFAERATHAGCHILECVPPSA